MKQSDIFSVIIIATVGTLAAYFAVNSFLGDPNLSSEQIKTIKEITAELSEPDPELFNPGAINPTVEVEIDGCVDIDGNNILSYEELVNCGKIIEEEAEGDTVYTCPDGTKVTDMSICEYLDENSEENNPEEQTPITPEGQ